MEFVAEVAKLSKLHYNHLQIGLVIRQDGFGGRPKYTHFYSENRMDLQSFLHDFLENMHTSTAVSIECQGQEINMSFNVSCNLPVNSRNGEDRTEKTDSLISMPILPVETSVDIENVMQKDKKNVGNSPADASSTQLIESSQCKQDQKENGSKQKETRKKTEKCKKCGTVCPVKEKWSRNTVKPGFKHQSWYFCTKCPSKKSSRVMKKCVQRKQPASTTAQGKMPAKRKPRSSNLIYYSIEDRPSCEKCGRVCSLHKSRQKPTPTGRAVHYRWKCSRCKITYGLSTEEDHKTWVELGLGWTVAKYYAIEDRPACPRCSTGGTIIGVDKKNYYRWRCSKCHRILGLSTKADHKRWKEMGYGRGLPVGSRVTLPALHKKWLEEQNALKASEGQIGQASVSLQCSNIAALDRAIVDGLSQQDETVIQAPYTAVTHEQGHLVGNLFDNIGANNSVEQGQNHGRWDGTGSEEMWQDLTGFASRSCEECSAGELKIYKFDDKHIRIQCSGSHCKKDWGPLPKESIQKMKTHPTPAAWLGLFKKTGVRYGEFIAKLSAEGSHTASSTTGVIGKIIEPACHSKEMKKKRRPKWVGLPPEVCVDCRVDPPGKVIKSRTSHVVSGRKVVYECSRCEHSNCRSYGNYRRISPCETPAEDGQERGNDSAAHPSPIDSPDSIPTPVSEESVPICSNEGCDGATGVRGYSYEHGYPIWTCPSCFVILAPMYHVEIEFGQQGDHVQRNIAKDNW